MKRRNFLLHSVLLLCFLSTAISSYASYEEYADFIVDGIAYFTLGYDRCRVIGLTDTVEVVNIPDWVTDDGVKYRVTEIGFGGLAPLRNGVVNCPRWLEQIETNCFRNTDLVAIHFQENDSIEEFKIAGEAFENSKIREIEFPSNFKRVMAYTFFGCDSLQRIGWSENIRSIDQYAFHHCKSLREVRIPNKVEGVHLAAFMDCALETVWLSRSLKAIGEAAFNTCSLVDVQHVYVPTGRLAACSVRKSGINSTFQGKNSVVVHVPVGTIDLFEQSEGWSSYELQEDATLGQQHLIEVTVNNPDSGVVSLENAEFYKGQQWIADDDKPITIIAQPRGNCELRCCIINGIDVSDQFDAEGRYTIDAVNEVAEIYISFNSASRQR